MKIVISPAKTLDFESRLPTNRGTQPVFLETTAEINKKLSRMSKKKISELMDISDKLADLNYQRYHQFSPEHNKQNSRPAMYAFAGDVFVGLDAYSIAPEKLDQMQDKLRILSGFYGILRPLDLIQPYRLEMGTSLSLSRKKNLYEIWQKKVTDLLNSQMKTDEVLVNLASQEYFKVLDREKLRATVVTPVFKDLKDGNLRIISFFAKKARGAMVRYIIDHNITDIEDLKGFDVDGYRFSDQESSGLDLVFTR